MKRIFKWIPAARLLAVAAALVIAVALFGASGVAAFVVFFGNNEYDERASQTIDLATDPGDNPIHVMLIVHKLLPEENAAEVSIVVNAQGDAMLHLDPTSAACFSLIVDDRSPDRAFPPRTYRFDCKAGAGENFVTRESPRFLLPAWQSVSMFPFDDVQIWPIVRLVAQTDWPPARYSATKAFPGRVISNTGNELNWAIHFARSPNQKIAILAGAALFVLLTIFVSARILFGREPLSALQDLIAVASYVVAAVGFRELLGLNKSIGTSAFEIAFFILPLAMMAISMAGAQARAFVWSTSAPPKRRLRGRSATKPGATHPS
jgi:hypothetical protein